jgi:O-antigen/teichoic acid export membrane protein
VLSISFIGLYNSISYFLLRLKRYGLLSVSKFIRSVIIVATQLVFVLFYDKSIYGLIVGFTLGQIFSSAFLLVFSAKQIFCSRVEWSFFVKVLSKYKKFPLFYLPSFSCNIASREIVVILMSQVFNPIYIGYYALVNRVVGSPLSIVGDSFGQVFFQKYSESYRKKLDLELFFKSSLKKLIVLSLVGFGIIAILSPTVFGFVFGKECASAFWAGVRRKASKDSLR